MSDLIIGQLNKGSNVCLWCSLPCTAWCAWQRVNITLSEAAQQRITEARAHSIHMIEVLLTSLRRVWKRPHITNAGVQGCLRVAARKCRLAAGGDAAAP